MLDVGDAVVRSWALLPWTTAALIITALVYLRGFRLLQTTRPTQFPAWRAALFLAGLASLWLALASPLDAMGGFLLTAHMVQHFMLMSVAPPLLLLGYPTVPLLRGLPRALMRDGLGPYFSMGWVHQLQRLFAAPIFGWLAMNIAYIGWHIPAAYELTLRSQPWHEVEHACFFLTSLAFWWNVVQPWPSRPRSSRWMVLFYLVSADLVNTGLSASLVFSGKLFYPTYAAVPRISALSPLNDQVAAGAFMWVIGSAVFLLPAIAIPVTLLGRRKAVKPAVVFHILQPSRPARFDLLRIPFFGTMLHARYGRMSLQSITLLISAIVIAHGFWGHPMSSMNLAGVVPWNYVRAFGLVALILFGNLFCMVCPFMLPRELGHRLGLATHAWPPWLRNKWLAVGLIIVFFWSYEQFALWDAPLKTAWLLIGYFAAAFLVDTFFRGASFCKYVCPIGQFNFVSSLFSPTELTVRSQSTCTSCEMKDCIRGNETQRGCELDLFLPQKVGNLDCTLCMDCVKACPHDNVAIYAVSPMREVSRDPLRSSIRRLSTRLDIGMVILAVASAAFLNAAAMVEPISAVLAKIAGHVPCSGRILISAGGTLLACTTIVALTWLLTAWMRRMLPPGARTSVTGRQLFNRFVLTMLPLGLAMWTAHLLFHFLTTWHSAWQLLQQFIADSMSKFGLHTSISPDWSQAVGTAMSQPSLLAFQLLLLDAGLLLSLYAAWRVACEFQPRPVHAVRMLSPWFGALVALYAFGFWILLQPMQMRGMLMQG